MKKIYKMFSVILGLFLALGVASCKENTEPIKTEPSIVTQEQDNNEVNNSDTVKLEVTYTNTTLQNGTIEDTVEAIVNFFQENRSNLDVIKPILKEVKNLGYDKPQSISDLDDAKAILNLCK